jgi:hypothetical protein
MGSSSTDFSNSVTAQLTRAYTTFSGVDITALFDDMVIMTVQGIAISITREKVPVYCLGSARPKSISRGKRGIAGTMQFVLFDRDALYSLVKSDNHKYYAHANEVNWLLNTFNAANYAQDVRNALPGGLYDEFFSLNSDPSQGTAAKSVATEAQYMDQIFPFDVTLIAQNEYGQGAYSAVVGCEIINEGGGISMDDITSETQATYIAIHRHPWTPIETEDRDGGNTQYEIGRIQLDENGNLVSPIANNPVTEPTTPTP